MASGHPLMVQCKANHPRLLKAIETHRLRTPTQDRYATTEYGHGRYECREVRCFPLPKDFGHEPWHQHFRLAIEVSRCTQQPARTPRGWEVRRSETAYYLATDTFSAHAAAQAIRQHWPIENRLHPILDVAFEEDRNRTHLQPGILARLRRSALNLLRFNGESSIRDALFENALDIEKVLTYKGI